MSEIEEAVDQIINRRGDWAVALDWLADIAQGKKPETVAAPDYARRIADDVYWSAIQNQTGTLDALAEAARRGYELGYGAAQGR